MQYIQLQPQASSGIPTPSTGSVVFFIDTDDSLLKIKDEFGNLLFGTNYLSGGTFSDGKIILTNADGSNFEITGLTEVYVTGGTYSAGTITFENNLGENFEVTGLTTLDIYVTGGTFSAGTITFNDNNGGQFEVTGLTSSDIYLTGGTYSAGTITFTDNNGGGFDVTGLISFDTFVTGGTFSAGTITFTDNNNSQFEVTGLTSSDIYVTGGTFSAGTITFTDNNNSQFEVTGLTSNAIIEVVHNELLQMRDMGMLIPGMQYLITDYQTCYDQPDYDYNFNPITSGNYRTAEIDPILVLATGNNTISPDAYQPSYPNDKIKYDISFQFTEVTGSLAKGRITERIDEFNNRTDYDHRTIKFKRYYSYSLDERLNGYVQSINSTTLTGIDTSFNVNLSPGDIIFVPSPNSQGRGFYKVTSVDSATSIQITGHNYFNFDLSPNDGLPIYKCILNRQDVYGEASDLSLFKKDGAVEVGDTYFGASSSYFTNCYPGLFVMVADNINVTSFEINGDVGADGFGSIDVYEYSTTIGGSNYKAYAKRIEGASDPSVNHIIIVNTDGTGITHNYSTNTNNDFDQLTGLDTGGVTQVHYLLTGLRFGVKISDAEVDAIVEAYLVQAHGYSIGDILSNLNSNYETITGVLPARNPSTSGTLYYFNDSGDNSINDGGDDMYDFGGNRLRTNIYGGNIPYTHTQMGIYNAFDWYQSNVIENVDFDEFGTFENTEAKNNYIGNFAKYYNTWYEETFLLSNNIFGRKNSNSDPAFNNHFSVGAYNNTFGGEFLNNRFVGRTNGNVFYDDVYDNTVLEDFYNNKDYGNNFYGNEIGTDFYENIICDDSFYRNDVGNNFNNNIIIYDFQNNVVGNNFQNNFFLDEFYKNKVGNGFNNNKIYRNFYGNDIGNAFNGNEIYFNFRDNRIGEYYENNRVGDISQVGFYEFFFNNIGNSTTNNTINGSFAHNLIGNYFQSNIIEDGFGFGGGNSQKNIIGDYFQNNQIGEYFYNNTIANYFTNNQVYEYFQWNVVNTSVNGIDFTTNYGNITTFTYSALGSSATDNTYNDLSTTTNNNGVNATFDVGVGSGAVTAVTLNNIGKLYQNSDSVTILGSQIGGTDGVDDISITVTGVNPNPSVYEQYSCTIFQRSDGAKRLSYYDNLDTLTIIDINA